MPNRDGTGPMSQGAGTGRGMGPCGASWAMGSRFASRYNRSGGYDRGPRKFISSKNELAALEDEERMLQEQLAVIKSEKEALSNQK